MVDHKGRKKGTKRILDLQTDYSLEISSTEKNDSRSLSFYSPYHQLPAKSPLIQQVPSQNSNHEHIKLVWEKDTNEARCESSLPFSADDVSLRNFCNQFVQKASVKSRDLSTRVQADSDIKRSNLFASQLEDPVSFSEELIKNGIRSKKLDQRKRRKAGSDPPYIMVRNLIEDNEESDDADEVEFDRDDREVRISDTIQFTCFYDTMFRHIGQLSMKKILKCWIKKIHPKKQAKYPYNGGKLKDKSKKLYGDDNPGEETKPPWWPPSIWHNKGERIRHKEPDHQYKPERLVLAVWLLRYFLVEGLRESTADIAPSLDPKSRIVVPPLLKEVYRVREIEEQLTRGDKHIDRNTKVHIPNHKLKGSLKNTKHPEPTSRPPMKLPFVIHSPDPPSLLKSELNLQDPKSIDKPLENASGRVDFYAPVITGRADVITDEQCTFSAKNLLGDESQTACLYRPTYSESIRFDPSMASNFVSSSFQDVVRHPVKQEGIHTMGQIPLSSTGWMSQHVAPEEIMQHAPISLPDSLIGDMMGNTMGSMVESDMKNAHGLAECLHPHMTPGIINGPHYQSIPFPSNLSTLPMDEQLFGHLNQIAPQQMYDSNAYRHSFGEDCDLF